MSGAHILLCLGLLAACSVYYLGAGEVDPAEAERPNILWLTCEDISPDLGCYGVSYAKTPNLDRLASQGVLYEQAFAITGVCAPNRSCLITGVWPSTLGSHDMRSTTRLPANIKCFSEYLRDAGYYCTNASKTDYNFATPKSAWDDCSRKGHWRGRAKDQPFFAVFNATGTHESQCRGTPRDRKAFPLDQVPIPPFHPDTPEVRGNWARYHENISLMDTWARKLLDQLEEDGLADNTIVFFYSDHGAGLPGCKKWVWEDGLRVPLIVRFPEKYAKWSPGKPGTRTDRLVSFVDFAPTVLSLTGVKIPQHMQGQAFLGPQAQPPRERVFAIRDRMAERYDTVRVVRDRKFQYMRNYFPQVPWSQFVSYTEMMPTMQVWRKRHGEGKLNAVQERYFTTKPLEELYDCENDPHQVNNLADEPKYADVMKQNRKALREWMARTHDMGLLPEFEMHTRAEGSTPFDVASDPKKHPQEELMKVADLANARDAAKLPELTELLKSAKDPAVRWWATVGIVCLGKKALSAEPAIRAALKDVSPLVRVAAAEALCAFGMQTDALPVLEEALKHPTPFIRMRAMNVLDYMGPAAKPLAPAMRKAKMNGIMPASFLSRMTEYVPDRLEGKEK